MKCVCGNGAIDFVHGVPSGRCFAVCQSCGRQTEIMKSEDEAAKAFESGKAFMRPKAADDPVQPFSGVAWAADTGITLMRQEKGANGLNFGEGQPSNNNEKECWWHKWEIVKDTGKHRYYECAKCGKRKIVQAFSGGYQPIDATWPKGGGASSQPKRK